MYSNPQKRAEVRTQELRKEAGKWLRELRERRNLSQRQLAHLVGVEYYTFISQLETGRGRIPPDKYRLWAKALDVPARDFVMRLFRYYDPLTYEVLFIDECTDMPEKKKKYTGLFRLGAKKGAPAKSSPKA